MDYIADPLGLCGMRNSSEYSYISDVFYPLKSLLYCDGFLQGLNHLSTLVPSAVFIPIIFCSELYTL